MPESILEVAKRVDQFFMETSPIHETMRRLAKVFQEMDIPFAIAGAMAANAHGHKRTTADVDILIRAEDLERFKQAHRGLGWVDIFHGSKNFRDAVTNVKVDALLVGGYPGDGLPKAVVFPMPENAATKNSEGIPVLNLNPLLELKMASGMTAPHRMQDLADVMQLIRINQLPRALGQELNPYVAAKYDELWQAAQTSDDY